MTETRGRVGEEIKKGKRSGGITYSTLPSHDLSANLSSSPFSFFQFYPPPLERKIDGLITRSVNIGGGDVSSARQATGSTCSLPPPPPLDIAIHNRGGPEYSFSGVRHGFTRIWIRSRILSICHVEKCRDRVLSRGGSPMADLATISGTPSNVEETLEICSTRSSFLVSNVWCSDRIQSTI